MILHTDPFDNYATADILDVYTQVYLGTGPFTMPTIGPYGRRGTNGMRFLSTAVSTPDRNNPGACSLVLGQSSARTGFGMSVTFTGGFGNLSAFSQWGLGSSLSPVSSLSNTQQNGIPICCIMLFRAAALTQVAITLNRDGTLSAMRGSGVDNVLAHDLEKVVEVLGTTVLALQTDTTYYIEASVGIDSATGTVEIRVDGDVWLSLSGVNTQADNTPSYTAELAFGMVRNFAQVGLDFSMDVDDLVYWNDDASNPLNTTVDFLGDVNLTYYQPIADDLRGWIPLIGVEHYLMVEEIPPDGDASYNYTTSNGAIDTFEHDAIPTSGIEILGVTVLYDRRRTSGGNTSTAPVWRVGGTPYLGGAAGDPSTYAYNQDSWTQNPATTGTITPAVFNASTFGYKKVS